MEKIPNNKIKKSKEDLILKEALTPEYDFDFEINKNESNEEYLLRLNYFIYERRFQKEDAKIKLDNNNYVFLDDLDKSFLGRDNYSMVYKKAYSILLEHKEYEIFNNKKNIETLNLLKLRINKNTRTLTNKSKNFYSRIEYFNNTNQFRNFFPRGDYEKDDPSYADSLMGIEFRCEESEEYLKSKLDGKNICILGGGKSIQDLIENNDIKPESIINIDPYLDNDLMERNIKNNYKSLNLRADDKYLYQKIKKQNIDDFDEIWASFSVPYYNKNPEEINNLFNNIDRLLKEGGNCRITPLSVQNSECENKLLEKLNELNNTGKFNFTIFGDTLLIHKLKNKENDK